MAPLTKVLLNFYLVLQLISCSFIAFAQQDTTVLLKKWQENQQKSNFRSDTANVTLLLQLADAVLYNNTTKALNFAKQAFELAQFQKNEIAQANAMNNIGNAYYIMGSYSLSMDAATKQMDISNAINYQSGKAGAFQIMGLIYVAQEKYQEAISQFSKALDGFTQLNKPKRISKIYFNLALCYDETKRPYIAFGYLNKTIALGQITHDDHIVSMSYNRMGETYFHMKNYEEAIANYQKVLGMNYQDNWERAFAFSGLAQAYYGLGRYQDAITYANQSLAMASATNSRWDAIRALKISANAYAANGDYKNAYNSQALLKKYNDTLLNTNNEREINYLHLKQQQEDNARLQKEIELNRQKLDLNNIIIAATGLLAIFAIVVVVIISRNNLHKTALNKQLHKKSLDIASQNEEISRQKEALDELNRNKDQLFSVISHDLRSPFASILQPWNLYGQAKWPARKRS